MPRATLLLADDHAVVAEGLATLLRGEFSLVGTVANGAKLLQAARRLRPDVILTDLAMPEMSGLDALRELQAEGLKAKVVFLTMYANANLAAEVLRAGASGFIVKDASGPEIIAAIQTVLRGRTYVPSDLAADVLSRLAESRAHGAATLTPRQRDVARLLSEGQTVKEIAAVLGLSTRSVETHKYQALETLGLRTTADLIRYALEHGFVTPPRQR